MQEQAQVLADWKEFQAPDGRKYYHNKTTKESRWQMPEEFRLAQAAAAAAAAVAAATAKAKSAPSATATPSSNVKTSSGAASNNGVYIAPVGVIQTGPTPHYATTAEAKDAFKQLLRDLDIPLSMSWDESVKVIMQDRRYGALKTVGEKKTAFHEYVQQRKKEEAEEARKRRLKVTFFLVLFISTEGLCRFVYAF